MEDQNKKDDPSQRNLDGKQEVRPTEAGDYSNVADIVEDDKPEVVKSDEDQKDDENLGGLMTEERKQRLFAAVEHSYRELRQFRDLNRTLIEEFTGPSYTDNETHPVKYINLMSQAVEGYTMLLVGSNPQVFSEVIDKRLAGFANHFSVAINNLLDEIEIRDTFREWVRNSFFGIGVLKIHMADSGELVAEDDILMDPGTPFASVVSIDDWVHDYSAKRWSECKFQGDMYRIPFDELQNGYFDEDAIKDLQPSNQANARQDRVEDMTREGHSTAHEFEEMIDLIDIYVPRDGLIYTFAIDDRRLCTLKGDPIAIREWTGNETGPYKKLCLKPVPDNTMPVPPASEWVALDKLANNLMRKAARQAKRAKQILAYTPQGADGAARIRQASDGDMVEVQDVSEMQPVGIGGVDPAVNSFMLQSMELFDRMAGNLSAILGLGSSTESVGQEKLIHGATSRMEQSMQATVMYAANEVVRDIAQLLWDDKYKTIPGVMQLEGQPDFTADSTWTPDDREGVFSDYKIQLDVYSMTYQGPGERMMVINQLLQQMYAPLLPILQQQGGTIDMQELTNRYASMLNQPAINDIIRFQNPVQLPEAGQQMDQPRKAPVTNRTYTRRNVSAGDESGVPQTNIPQPAEPKT